MDWELPNGANGDETDLFDHGTDSILSNYSTSSPRPDASPSAPLLAFLSALPDIQSPRLNFLDVPRIFPDESLNAFGAISQHSPADDFDSTFPSQKPPELLQPSAPFNSLDAISPPQNSVSSSPPTDPMRKQARKRYRAQDWDEQRPNIQRFYMSQDKSLDETMKTMKALHGFDASKRAYKNKINDWGFLKYVNKQQAAFISRRKRRRRAEGKETTFYFNTAEMPEARVDRTVARANDDVLSRTGSTPSCIRYETPRDLEAVTVSSRASSVESSFSQSLSGLIPLRWKGLDKESLEQLFTEGNSLEATGRSEEARKMYQQSLDGFRHLMGAVNDNTTRVTLRLADSLETDNRLEEAKFLISQWTNDHAVQFGNEHPRTLDCLCRLGEFFFSGRRFGDSEVILNRVLGGLARFYGYDSKETYLKSFEKALFLAHIKSWQSHFEQAYDILADLLSKAERFNDVLEKIMRINLAILANCGDYIMRERRITDATISETLDYFEKRYPEYRYGTMNALVSVCNGYCRLGDEENAKGVVDRIFRFLDNTSNISRVLEVRSLSIYYFLANILRWLGREEESQQQLLLLKSWIDGLERIENSCKAEQAAHFLRLLSHHGSSLHLEEALSKKILLYGGNLLPADIKEGVTQFVERRVCGPLCSAWKQQSDECTY